MLSSFFSETKCKPAKKITGEWFTSYLKITCKNLGTVEGKTNLPKKVTNVPLAPSRSIVVIEIKIFFGVAMEKELKFPSLSHIKRSLRMDIKQVNTTFKQSLLES